MPDLLTDALRQASDLKDTLRRLHNAAVEADRMGDRDAAEKLHAQIRAMRKALRRLQVVAP